MTILHNNYICNQTARPALSGRKRGLFLGLALVKVFIDAIRTLSPRGRNRRSSLALVKVFVDAIRILLPSLTDYVFTNWCGALLVTNWR